MLEAFDIRGYRKERRRVLHVLNALLAPYTLHVEDWDGEAYQVTAASGASVKVDHLSNLWAALPRIGMQPFDPLSIEATDSKE